MSGLSIAPAPVIARPPVIRVAENRDDAGAGSVTQNTLLFFRVMPASSFRTTKVDIYVGTAANNVDIAIGTVSAGTFTRLAAIGQTAAAGVNAPQEFNLTFDWVAGQEYFVCFGTDSATITVARYQPISPAFSALGGQAYSKASGWSSGIPASVPALSASVDRVISMTFY